MSKKMPRRLVALSSSAVAAIYFAGLLSTRSVSFATPTSVPAVVAGATASTGYQDGTYSGTGAGRFGSVTVAVTTSGGKIANVQITNAATTFPVSQIASLPAQVVQSQNTTVNAVTGATASAQAFKQAVQQALVQAAASTTATSATA
jgi:NosR/NirI family nitrous oxide reductase transcriptional regulator